MNERRILAVGKYHVELSAWVVTTGEHPLPASARKELEAAWPALAPDDAMTPEQLCDWFDNHFQPTPVVVSTDKEAGSGN